MRYIFSSCARMHSLSATGKGEWKSPVSNPKRSIVSLLSAGRSVVAHQQAARLFDDATCTVRPSILGIAPGNVIKYGSRRTSTGCRDSNAPSASPGSPCQLSQPTDVELTRPLGNDKSSPASTPFVIGE